MSMTTPTDSKSEKKGESYRRGYSAGVEEERGRILKLLDTDDFKIEEGMHYSSKIDVTEIPDGLIAEMKGLRMGWDAVIKLLKEKLASLGDTK